MRANDWIFFIDIDSTGVREPYAGNSDWSTANDLGQVDGDVVLDFKGIAQRFNRYYDKMNTLCLNCSNADFCKKCLFYCNVENAQPVCNQYCNQTEFLGKLSDNTGELEEKHNIYYKHLTEI